MFDDLRYQCFILSFGILFIENAIFFVFEPHASETVSTSMTKITIYQVVASCPT